jgi:Ni/Co efflux regulator RcnB
MKKLLSIIVACGLAVAFASPSLAAAKTPTTKASCEKAKMHWDAATKTSEEQHVSTSCLL